jgi:NRAMP (natural resistance-associated macrophage protein)-like metal ion transporter
MGAKNGINAGRIAIILGILGPGIITAAVDNDAGGITTYSVAGAHFGYSMLWSLIPITILLIIVQEMCARMGAVTGKGLADLIRENFGVRITLLIMAGLLFANFFVTVAEFAGIASVAGMFNLNKFVVIPLVTLFVLVTVVKFNYKHLEKFFLTLTLFYFSYVLSGILAHPDWGAVATEMAAPKITFTTAYLVVLIGVVGTTITPWMQFYLQSSIVEKGIRAEEYKYSRWEVIIGCIITDIITFFIIVTCAAVLFQNNVRINDAVDAARALAPLAGDYAALLFAVGFFGASLFGAFIIPISTVYYVCESLGWESGINKKFHEAREFYLMLMVIVVLAAAVVLIPNIPLIKLMLAAQVVNGILLPFILIPIVLLVNNKRLMGEHTNSLATNAFTWASVVIIILITLAMTALTLMETYGLKTA